MPNVTERTHELYASAELELKGEASSRHPASFYQRKVKLLWERAKNSKAYAPIGPYSWDGFETLPVTTRQQLKEHPLDFLAVPVCKALKYYETTGTTGLPTPTPRLREDVIWNTVSVAEAWSTIIRPDDRVFIILPSDIVPVADLVVDVCEYLNIAHTKAYPFTLGISDWDRIEAVAKNFLPTVLFIAPGVCQQFTRILKQRGTFHSFSESVRTIMLLGEVNTSAFRARLGKWWDATAFDASYGSTETGTLAAACKEGHQHLLCGANYVEIKTDRGLEPLPESGEVAGRLVVTPLNLHARPLLRLDTGDLVTVSVGCPCGASSPWIEVHGRSTDAITIHAQPITVRSLEEVVYGVSNATGYLIEAVQDGSFARLLIERNPEWDRADEPRIVKDIQSHSLTRLGMIWNEIKFVNTLPTNTKSGASQKSWKRSNIRVIEVAA